MTQRFERRRPRGSEGGGDRPGPGGRGGGRPARFSGPRPDWRSTSPDREGREGREAREGREGGESRRGGRPGDRRESFKRPSGDGRPARVIPARPTAAKPAYGKPSFGKPAYGKPSFGKPAFGKPGLARMPSFGKPPFEKSRFGDRRPSAAGGNVRERAVDSSREREDVVEPSGESERFGAEPADDMIWGRHSAQAALESDRPIHRIWCTPELRFAPRFLQLLREAKAGGVLVEEVSWARLGQLTGGAVHQGIVLQAAAADTLDLASLIEGCRGIGEPPLLMAVDGLTDPHNLGAIVRSAEALGAHGLVLPQRRNAGLTGSVAKVAAGALEHLPVAKVVNLNRSLEQLKDEGYRVVGLAEEGTVSLIEADLDGPLVVVTGSESQGLSMLTRKHCDQLIRIPLRGATPSLNASVATALLLYEVARRGWMKTISGTAPTPRIVRPQLPGVAAGAVERHAEPEPLPPEPPISNAFAEQSVNDDDAPLIAGPVNTEAAPAIEADPERKADPRSEGPEMADEEQPGALEMPSAFQGDIQL
jgi:23S rRNA (guanosine2251-2'-O)-methyltransferase